MPVSLLNADTSFPSFTEGTSTSEKVDVMMNYLYMLLEELRYTFGNLGTENFNDKSLDELSVQLTKPVYGIIEDETAGLKHEIKVTAEGLESLAASVTEDAEALAQFKTQVSDTYATISSFASFKNEMNTAYTSFTQTADSKYATVSALASFKNDINSSFSSFTATAESTYAKATQIASVTNSSGKVTAASIVAAVNSSGSSVKISADKVDISGFVTFSDLADSSSITTINGAAISTGTLTASTYKMFLDRYGYSDGSVEFYYNQLSSNWKVGGIAIDDQGAGTEYENTYRVRIFTRKPSASSSMKFSLKLESCGRLSIEAPEYVYVESGENITIRANSGGGKINLDGDVYIRGTSLDEILASL